MAVQKSKKSRSKKRIRKNSKIFFKIPCISFNKDTNEHHIRHFISKTGYYKNKKIIEIKKKKLSKNS